MFKRLLYHCIIYPYVDFKATVFYRQVERPYAAFMRKYFNRCIYADHHRDEV